MTTSDLIESIGKDQPELIEKLAGVVKEIENEAPEFLPELYYEFDKISSYMFEKVSAPGVIKGLKEYFTADSGAKDTAGGDIGKALIGTGAAAGAGLLFAGGSDMYRAAKAKLTKARNYKRMIKAFPGLEHGVWDDGQPMTDEQRTRFPVAFHSVHSLAPNLAADPIAAAALTKQLTMSNDTPDSLKRALDAEKTYVDSRASGRLKPVK